ncbi:exosome complex component RRP4 homolog [Chenopodium quinoa]|uniref:exosome complex component RRP4 homolog n=1 Tax=Chenopodium quinoa TaxID=63459 RepID=UPI000B795C43|nr:exosome complex component RRP4 homolog [Chenopodium quinoa]
MREIELSLTQTQKIRLQRALEKLQSLSSKSAANASVTVADTISVNNEDNILNNSGVYGEFKNLHGYMGHGTLELDGEVVATVCGPVDRVDKLVIVRSLLSSFDEYEMLAKFENECQVAQKRWRVEIHLNQDVVLMLSSVTLPGGIQLYMEDIHENHVVIGVRQKVVQRQRITVDELNMSDIFVENDVISLERGQLIIVHSYLVERRK